MYHKSAKILPFFLFLIVFSLFFLSAPFLAFAQIKCQINDRSCILDQMAKSAQKIKNKTWRDQSLREIAKSYAFGMEHYKAISLLGLISTPDIRAVTIRGIGMTLGEQTHSQTERDLIFKDLRDASEEINNPPSYAIALIYISMAQAFAGDNSRAWETVSDLKNIALRNKAYGEIAQIQAKRQDFKSAQISIEKIETLAYRNKSYAIISEILSDQAMFENAYIAANEITNNYKRGKALQYLLDTQKPRKSKRQE